MKNGPNGTACDRPPLDPGMPWTSTAEFVAYKFRWLKQVIQRHRRLHKVALTVAVGLVDFSITTAARRSPRTSRWEKRSICRNAQLPQV
jgi:hypothetical protein